MLLNQCLAISLSPIATSSGHHEHIASFNQREPQEETRLSFAQILFRQLIEQNSPTNKSAGHSRALHEALDRLEFAGFMVPSWLLVSGAYDDLHCIKSSWSEGSFKSPEGFKIETIGK